MNKSTTVKTTKFNFQTTIQKPRNFNPSKFSTLTVYTSIIYTVQLAGNSSMVEISKIPFRIILLIIPLTP